MLAAQWRLGDDLWSATELDMMPYGLGAIGFISESESDPVDLTGPDLCPRNPKDRGHLPYRSGVRSGVALRCAWDVCHQISQFPVQGA